MKNLLNWFAEKAKGLDSKEKVRLILFSEGIKSNVEIILKIDKDNLEEKAEFEELLRKNSVLFSVSTPQGYEIIKKIKKNRIIWELEGTYYIYDLFKSKKNQEQFKKYLKLFTKHHSKKGDYLAGKHYGYPQCCINQFIKEKREKYLQKKYTYWQYYNQQKKLDHKFPFISHRPCNLNCKKSIQLEQKYAQAIKKTSPSVYTEYQNKSQLKGSMFICGVSDIEIKGKSIWPKKQGIEYELVFKRPFRRQYYLITFLSQKKYSLGQILKGEVTFQYDYTMIKIKKEKKKVILGIHHERKLPLLGEVTIK